MKFYKFNGAGNDFIIINNIDEGIDPARFPEMARILCRRHMSIGADGLMAVDSSDIADYKMLFYNSDGSAGEMCGNGARCICRFGYESGLAGETQTVETISGTIIGRRIDQRNYRIRLTEPSVIIPEMELEAGGRRISCGYVELGDPGLPHAVVHIPGLRSKNSRELFSLGQEIRRSPVFRKGANVNFYDIDAEGIYELTFERGVEDFTYACGTGTASLAIILCERGINDGQHTGVRMLGGELSVELKRDGSGRIRTVYLTGPTNMVAVGQITDEELIL